MHCPSCAGHSLNQEELAGIEVDRCPGCQGVWLDRGEGEMVTRPGELPPEVVERVLALAESQVLAPGDDAPRACPRCAALMQRELYAESQVEIDRCGCGVWLDEGELEKITAYRLRSMDELQRRSREAAGGGEPSFSAPALERAFARIYFDVGKEPGPG